MASRRTEKSNTFRAASRSSARIEATELALTGPSGGELGAVWVAEYGAGHTGRMEASSVEMGYVGNGIAHQATTCGMEC